LNEDKNLYPPLNTLKPVGPEVWIVDGPAIDFGPPLAKMKFPTRMTVLRIDGALFIHSPTPLTATLRQEVEAIGKPRWIIGPNKIHYWWIPDWHTAFPDAQVFLAPGIRKRAGKRIDFDCALLDAWSGYPWDAEVATLPVTGTFMTEAVFFHYRSRTLILTDLIENFEPKKLDRWKRILVRIGGVADPDGQMPRDMRLTFWRHRSKLRRAIEQMIDWDPERVILAHGRWYRSGGAAELRRAFRWLFD
jgi:hypothetical protein